MSRPASPDSLFSEPDSDTTDERLGVDAAVVARRDTPPIPGLWVFPDLLPADVASTALADIAAADHFRGGRRDQVMLFTRARASDADDGAAHEHAASKLPAHIAQLEHTLSSLLAPLLPTSIHALAFTQPLARQAILNLYPPGAGISPHVDLVGRYADGIVGASLTGGCVMTFSRTDQGVPTTCAHHDVYLPPRSVYVLTGTARWDWAHGIAYRTEDVVSDADGARACTLPRALRVSVTLRWLQPGGAVLS